MKRIFLPILIVLLTAGIALAEPAEGGKALSVKTFQFKYKDADRAAAVIKPLLSSEGSMSIQPSANSLVVTDRPQNLASVSAALAEFDVPARPLKLTVRLLLASRASETAKVPDELRDVATKLAMLRFTSVESLGGADLDSRENELGAVEFANGYRAEFRLGDYDPASKSVSVTDFRISRKEKDQTRSLYTASWNLKIGQTLIVPVTKDGQRAIVVVLVVRK
jgi:Bacterial type II/III secretion system short domain